MSKKIFFGLTEASTRTISMEEIGHFQVLFNTLCTFFRGDGLPPTPIYSAGPWREGRLRSWDGTEFTPQGGWLEDSHLAWITVDRTDKVRFSITLEGMVCVATVTAQELQDPKRVAVDWIEDILVRCDHEMSVGKETDRWERIINRINYQ